MAVQVRFASLQVTKVSQFTMIPQLCPQYSYGCQGALCQPPSYQSIAIHALVTFHMQTLVSQNFNDKNHVDTHTNTPTFVNNVFKFGVAAGIILF